MTGNSVAGITGTIVALWIWMWRSNKRADGAMRRQGLDVEHNRQVALSAIVPLSRPQLRLVADTPEDEIAQAVDNVLELHTPDGGGAA